MEVEKPAAPERFRYCDLKEAFRERAPYGDSIGCVTMTREALRGEAGRFRRKMACPELGQAPV
jgi:hypothetical protein